MTSYKNTVLLFSKLPEVGLVKTRLSVLKDGCLAPEDAARLYEAMLLDVVETICTALAFMKQHDAEGAYELVISVAPQANLPAMEKLIQAAGPWPAHIIFICDKGANFDEHYNHAFAQCWEAGSDLILSMGADMPALTVADVVLGIQKLQRLADSPRGGIVLAPDQEMGVSVIGWPRQTAMGETAMGETGIGEAAFDHSGVYYCQSGLTVLPAYIAKAREAQLPVLYLPPIPDVDTMADLRHNITLVEALKYCATCEQLEEQPTAAPHRTAAVLESLGISQVRVAPNNLFDPRDEIDQ